MKKGDVGMAKRFSKKYGNKGWASTTCNPVSRCLHEHALSQPVDMIRSEYDY